MNHFIFMELHKKANLLMLHYSHGPIILVVLVANTFKSFHIHGLTPWIIMATFLSHSTLACTLGGMNPTSHAIMHRRSSMAMKVNLTSMGLRTSRVSPMITWNKSHLKFACLFVPIVVFCSDQTKGLFKTHVFMATWSWHFGPLS